MNYANILDDFIYGNCSLIQALDVSEMSGLEIIALVLNASDISCKVIAAAIDYGKKVRIASRQTEEIKNEVQKVSKLLDDLHARAEKAEESGSPLRQWPSLKDIDSKGSPMMQIKLELKIVLDLLSTKKASKIEHLLWPRKAKKVEKSMQSVIEQREALVQRIMVDTGSVQFSECYIDLL